MEREQPIDGRPDRALRLFDVAEYTAHRIVGNVVYVQFGHNWTEYGQAEHDPIIDDLPAQNGTPETPHLDGYISPGHWKNVPVDHLKCGPEGPDEAA